MISISKTLVAAKDWTSTFPVLLPASLATELSGVQSAEVSIKMKLNIDIEEDSHIKKKSSFRWRQLFYCETNINTIHTKWSCRP